MSEWWYCNHAREQFGPYGHSEMVQKRVAGEIQEDFYVWCDKYTDWIVLSECSDLNVEESDSEKPKDGTAVFDITQIGLEIDQKTSDPTNISRIGNGTQSIQISKEELKEEAELAEDESFEVSSDGLELTQIDPEKKSFFIKIGLDRGGSEVEYGPYSLNILKKLAEENRINSKTLIFTPGMENWSMIGDMALHENVFGDQGKSEITDFDRRSHIRRPIVARLFFHDNHSLYEGTCRDVSLGGMQVLISDFPGRVGDQISLNVHPDNKKHHFVASGEVIRVLEGGLGFSFRFVDLSSVAKTAISKYIDESR